MACKFNLLRSHLEMTKYKPREALEHNEKFQQDEFKAILHLLVHIQVIQLVPATLKPDDGQSV